MWQRIQTLFLIVVILCLTASIFLPIWVSQESPEKSRVLYALHYGIKEKGPNGTVMQSTYLPYSITACFIVAAITIAFISIGKYNNRLLQLKLGAFNALMITASACTGFYFSYGLQKEFGGIFGFGLWLPFGAALTNFLANQFIKRDEKLVRDSDRLR